MKIDWKRKLTSRKFWMGVAMVITGIVIFVESDRTPEAITGLVMAIGGGVGYMIGEGIADSGSNYNNEREENENGISEAGQNED